MLTHLLRILKYGTSYAIATGFFPKAIAQDVLLLYSFVRIPDNIVDTVKQWDSRTVRQSNSKEKDLDSHYSRAKIQLEQLYQSRRETYEHRDTRHPQWGQYVDLWVRKEIPFQYSNAFFKAMIDDCTVHRYETYKQLEWYMYGSASVVGLMMCHLIGFVDAEDEEKAKPYAIELGNAMQLTNFLRDVREDYEELGRIYIPLSIQALSLKTWDLSWSIKHEDIITFCHWWYATASEEKKQARADTMKVYIAQCRTMYAHSLDGLQYLQPEWRKAVRLAALLYEAILDKIEENNYDVFTKSAKTSLRDKAKVLYRYKTQWISA